jgi:hypothetical protein
MPDEEVVRKYDDPLALASTFLQSRTAVRINQSLREKHGRPPLPSRTMRRRTGIILTCTRRQQNIFSMAPVASSSCAMHWNLALALPRNYGGSMIFQS